MLNRCFGPIPGKFILLLKAVCTTGHSSASATILTQCSITFLTTNSHHRFPYDKLTTKADLCFAIMTHARGRKLLRQSIKLRHCAKKLHGRIVNMGFVATHRLHVHRPYESIDEASTSRCGRDVTSSIHLHRVNCKWTEAGRSVIFASGLGLSYPWALESLYFCSKVANTRITSVIAKYVPMQFLHR